MQREATCTKPDSLFYGNGHVVSLLRLGMAGVDARAQHINGSEYSLPANTGCASIAALSSSSSMRSICVCRRRERRQSWRAGG